MVQLWFLLLVEPPYSITWPQNPAASSGTYTVTATDAAGCAASIDVIIDEPSQAVLGCTDPNAITSVPRQQKMTVLVSIQLFVQLRLD